MLFEVLRGCWCNVIVLNVHAPSEETSDVLKDSSCEILEQVFDHRKILFEDFKAKMGGETISKPTNGNESLHQASNDNAVRIVHSATSKNRDIKSTLFQRNKILKYTWTSHFRKTHNQTDQILIDTR